MKTPIGKIPLAVLSLAGVLAAGSVSADARRGIEQGEVIQARPVFRLVEVPESRQVCYDREVRHTRGRAAPTVLGGIIGGVVGNRFGGGNGRRALTVAGAALGASIGHDRSARRTSSHIETECEVVREYHREEQLIGYDVEYEYNGRVYHTRTDRDPGRYIDLEVSVRPIAGR